MYFSPVCLMKNSLHKSVGFFIAMESNSLPLTSLSLSSFSQQISMSLNVHLSLSPHANTKTLFWGLNFLCFLPLQAGSMNWARDWNRHTMATIPWEARPSEVPILPLCTSPSAASPALGLGMCLLIQMQKRSSPSAPC